MAEQRLDIMLDSKSDAKRPGQMCDNANKSFAPLVRLVFSEDAEWNGLFFHPSDVSLHKHFECLAFVQELTVYIVFEKNWILVHLIFDRLSVETNGKGCECRQSREHVCCQEWSVGWVQFYPSSKEGDSQIGGH